MPMMVHSDCRCCQMACREFDEYVKNLLEQNTPREELEKKVKEFFEDKSCQPWMGHCQSCWNQFHNGECDQDYDDSFNPFKKGGGH